MTAVLLACGLVLLGGCSQKEAENPAAQGEGANEPAAKPIVAVTIVPEETFVKAVAGACRGCHACPDPLLSRNYEATPAEMEKFSKAQYIYCRGSAERPHSSERGDVNIVYADDVVPLILTEPLKRANGTPKSALPKRAKVMVESIEREIAP